MKKTFIISTMVLCLNVPSKAQDAPALIPYLTAMVNNLIQVQATLKDSEDKLKGIKRALTTVKDAEKFFKYALAVRETINLMVCLAENMNDLQFENLLRLSGVNHSNLLSDFLTCHYDIYYSTIDLDAELIATNIKRAFDPTEEMNIVQRLELINIVISEIEDIQYRTVSAKGALLEVMEKHIDAAIMEEYIILMNRI